VQHSGFSLDVTGQSTAPGAPVIQWPYWNGRNEHWYLKPTSEGYYTVVNQNSGLCLDISGADKTLERAPTDQAVCKASDSQQWKLVASTQ
jgi:hypothetical protein